jgi:hypothetical protein
MRRLAATLILGFTWLAFPAGPVHAGECIRDAAQLFRECKADCRGDFLDAKAGCLNVTPGCYLACKEGKQECIADAEQPLTDCLALCEPPLEAARAGCRTACGCGGPGNRCGFNPCFIGCVDPAQATAFACRDTCRDAFKLNTAAQAALAACKTGFRGCLDDCPPAQ